MRPRAKIGWLWLAARGVAIGAAALVSLGIAGACDTPVYRYATYNWTPSPYRIYYVSRGEPLAADHPVRQAIVELTTAPQDAPRSVANLELVEIDAAAENPLEPLPAPLRDEAGFVLERATRAEDGGAVPELPRFAVVLPNGYPVYEGPLSEGDVRRIADSPARRKLVELLAGGKATVIVLLEGAKDEDNAAAEKLIAATIARATEGELSPPPDPALSTTGPDAKPAPVDVGTIRLRRDDPAEKWFAMSLLHVEPDIEERTEPMVFSVYARGRVNPPAIGTGISAEELERQVRFVLGPCACTVKHDNPGMDLALVADWDAIALAMAKRFGSETGNEHLLGDVPGLFPEIVDVGEPPAMADSKTEPKAGPTKVDSPAAGVSAETAADNSPASLHPSTELAPNRTLAHGASSDGSRPDKSRAESPGEGSQETTLLRKVGAGVVVAVVLLGIASLALFRRPA